MNLGLFLKLCLYALRYDLSTILALNGLYILFFLTPVSLTNSSRWQQFLKWLFLIPNIIALTFEVCDWAYFPYNFKRATAGVFEMITRKADFLILLPRFIVDYCYLPFFLAALISILVKINTVICNRTTLTGKVTLPMGIVRLLLVAGLTIVGIRGGLQLIPINLRNTLEITDGRYVSIVSNTPFSILNTFQGQDMEEINFYHEDELRHYFNPVKQYSGKRFQPKNVVLIIVESFSKEFSKLGGKQSFTPFIDSLMDRSLVCTHAYANALHSADGVPAVICGVPSLMDDPIATSNYSTNNITALPNTLKKKGYTSAFYHGATNGSMCFDLFAKSVGYDSYFGRKEYNNEKEYDGNWGIRDEPFLQYFANGLSKMKPPFMASVFTLSSHPPYQLPAVYEQTLPKGDLPIDQCIAYMDMSVKEFFETAAKQPWYSNTLFVITADHCSPMSNEPYNPNNLERYSIPLLYYCPSDTMLRGRFDGITQQLDIMPSILDYLGYEQLFYTFGNSIFHKEERRFVVNEISKTYKWLMDGYLLNTTDTMPQSMYKFPEDSAGNTNLWAQKQQYARQNIIPYYRAFLQEYHSALIHNRMKIN